ncbi:hypothetical protein NM688_g1741 [Phlebia brevispora]|uniref:Uncharacterized protein n=1 Tax=Phlebia brevispora TaxID=194682 RepID=A0ACC1TAR5_9APHY|nr:hypothetical protein NM688_g1741 [Phlebia brevispora]
MSTFADFMAVAMTVLLPLALMLSGVFTVQVHYYLIKYDKDPLLLKVYVVSIWVVEILHSMLCIHVIYTSINANVEHSIELTRIVWFYAYRVWQLYKRHWLAALVPQGSAVVIRAGLIIATAAFM